MDLRMVLTWRNDNNDKQKCTGVKILGNFALKKEKTSEDESTQAARVSFLLFVKVGFRCCWWFPFVCVFNYADTACK